MVDILSSLNKNGSGIDFRSLSTSLVAAEFQPRVSAAEKKIAKVETTISAMGEIRAQLDKLSTAGKAIAATPVLSATSSSRAASVTISQASKTKEGTTEIYVGALARRQVIEFPGFSSNAPVLGTGSITVETGEWTDIDTDAFSADASRPSQTINISAGDTLETIAEKLSALDGVTARVLDKGDGTFSLGIVSEVGAKSGLRLSVTEDPGAPGLAALNMTTGAAAFQVQGASNALLEVDGFFVQRPTNTIDDLVPGVSIELAEEGLTTIKVVRDRETAADNLQFLAETMNETLTMMSALTSRGVNGAQRGALAGDLAGEAVISRLRNLMIAPIHGFGQGSLGLAELGLTIERNGTFRFDRNTFDAAFDKDPALFNAAFTDRLSSSDPRVTLGGRANTKEPYGTYSFSRPGGAGAATMDGVAAFGSDWGDGRTAYIAFSGDLSGVTVFAENGVESAEIHHARSFVSLLGATIDDLLSSDGQIAGRETQLSQTLVEQQIVLETLATKSSSAESRYLERFTAMEVAITQLKSTGVYLDNLIEQWNNAGN